MHPPRQQGEARLGASTRLARHSAGYAKVCRCCHAFQSPRSLRRWSSRRPSEHITRLLSSSTTRRGSRSAVRSPSSASPTRTASSPSPAAGQAAAQETWRAETNAPTLLRRRGWTATSLKAGDMITIEGWPSRDGKNYIRMQRVLRADGTELGAPTSAPGTDPSGERK